MSSSLSFYFSLSLSLFILKITLQYFYLILLHCCKFLYTFFQSIFYSFYTHKKKQRKNPLSLYDIQHTLYKNKQTITEDESDKDLVQNMHVILNPGFCDDDDQLRPLSPLKTHFYGGYHGNHQNDYEKDMTFSRKMSIFFTGNTIKRI